MEKRIVAKGQTAKSERRTRIVDNTSDRVSGRTALTGAKSDSSLGMLQGSSTLCAPRSDLHHRSGRGAFERLRASSPEVAEGCRDDGRWGRSAAHSRADGELKTTVCAVIV